MELDRAAAPAPWVSPRVLRADGLCSACLCPPWFPVLWCFQWELPQQGGCPVQLRSSCAPSLCHGFPGVQRAGRRPLTRAHSCCDCSLLLTLPSAVSSQASSHECPGPGALRAAGQRGQEAARETQGDPGGTGNSQGLPQWLLGNLTPHSWPWAPPPLVGVQAPPGLRDPKGPLGSPSPPAAPRASQKRLWP